MTIRKIKNLNIDQKFHVLPKGHNLLTVANPFSGVVRTLTPDEEAVYSYIMGAQAFPNPDYEKIQKCLDWFRKTNPEAYMELLD